MTNPVDGARGEGLGKIPEALSRRSVIVPLTFPVDGQSQIVVEKWCAEKLMSVLRLISTSLDTLTDEQMKAAGSGQFSRKVLPELIANLGDRAFGLVELSVVQEQRAMIRRLDAEDFMSALATTIDLNLTDGLVGKVVALGSSLYARFKRAATNTR
jgi:hypothetical protein